MFLMNLFPKIARLNEQPPTLYSILESIVNFEQEDKTKIVDLSKNARLKIFDFNYPLSEHIDKENFESMILNKFLMRRIGFETVTAFKIQLNVKLNEIMPKYNLMFNALENWNIFEDGEKTERIVTDNRTIDKNTDTTNNTNTTTENTTTNELNNNSTTTNNTIVDKRNSELPQNQLQNLRDGSYVSNYNYDVTDTTTTDKSNSNGKSIANGTNNIENTINTKDNTTDNNETNEIIKKTSNDKIKILNELQTNINNIYTLIFNDLDCLFYQLV